MGVLAVNWDDTTVQDVSLDLVAVGIAHSTADNCVTTDLKDGTKTNSNGGTLTYKDIAQHGHVALKIKCLPF